MVFNLLKLHDSQSHSQDATCNTATHNFSLLFSAQLSWAVQQWIYVNENESGTVVHLSSYLTWAKHKGEEERDNKTCPRRTMDYITHADQPIAIGCLGCKLSHKVP